MHHHRGKHQLAALYFSQAVAASSRLVSEQVAGLGGVEEMVVGLLCANAFRLLVVIGNKENMAGGQGVTIWSRSR